MGCLDEGKSRRVHRLGQLIEAAQYPAAHLVVQRFVVGVVPELTTKLECSRNELA